MNDVIAFGGNYFFDLTVNKCYRIAVSENEKSGIAMKKNHTLSKLDQTLIQVWLAGAKEIADEGHDPARWREYIDAIPGLVLKNHLSHRGAKELVRLLMDKYEILKQKLPTAVELTMDKETARLIGFNFKNRER